jgi:transcriptional regulator with XRE-family HTH domain
MKAKITLEQINNLLAQGKSQSEIAREFGISRQFVFYVLNEDRLRERHKEYTKKYKKTDKYKEYYKQYYLKRRKELIKIKKDTIKELITIAFTEIEMPTEKLLTISEKLSSDIFNIWEGIKK